MKLSKEIVDLECSKPLNFYQEFLRITNEDPEFAEILEHYEDEIAKNIEFENGSRITYTDKDSVDSYLIKSDVANRIVVRAMLNLYRIMSVQAEIDQVERECGTKEE
jgi:hypothetical protein